MAVRWDLLFGSDYLLDITNEERRFLALDPISTNWEITQYYSKTNICYTRTTVYWDKSEIRKVIYEENRLPDGYDIPIYRCITEHDTRLKTDHREKLVPLTPRGKPKPVTASNILAIAPFGCSFHYSIDTRHSADGADPKVTMMIYHSRNCLDIKIGEKARVAAVQNTAAFHSFMQYYMSSCPPDYFDRVEHLRTAKHQTIKYQTGDIFRMEIDRFRYCYGLITGKVREILKWPELPEIHSFRALMMIPIMVRYYDLITERSDLKADDLSGYPLSRIDICGDNDIIWGKHTIVDHKQLSEDEIEFPLICTRIKKPSIHDTTHSFDLLIGTKLLATPPQYNLYVEWGTASTILPSEQISGSLKSFLQAYHDPHGIVKIGILPNLEGDQMDLLNDHQSEMRRELFRCLGLEEDVDFDSFAVAFHGLTKEELLSKLI